MLLLLIMLPMPPTDLLQPTHCAPRNFKLVRLWSAGNIVTYLTFILVIVVELILLKRNHE